MACELVQFLPLEKRPFIRKSEAIATVIAFAVGWWWSKSLGVAVGLGIVSWFVTGVVNAKRIDTTVLSAAEKDMARRGYHPDFRLGHALIDSKARVVAFVDLLARNYALYRANDILGWEHQWIDKTSAAVNFWGTDVNANTARSSNVLVIKTNNPSNPLYKLRMPNDRVCEVWMARLDAIFNG